MLAVPSLLHDFHDEHWIWDENTKSDSVVLSKNSQTAFFHVSAMLESTGSAGVRGTKGFTDGEHYWEIEFLEPLYGTSVMVGVGTERTSLSAGDYQFCNLIGRDNQSWGLSYKGTIWHDGKVKSYCDPFFESRTILGVLLNMNKGTLSFYKNGQSLGSAFSSIPLDQKIYPVISSTAESTEMTVMCQRGRYLSLQDKCCLAVAKSLKNPYAIGSLPLPHLIKGHINDICC